MSTKFIDLTGRRFNHRVALGLGNKRKGRIQWKFQCDCGFTGECLGQSFKRSPRCEHCAYKDARPYRRLRPYEAQYRAFLNKARHEVKVTYEQFLVYTKIDKCHYCGFTIKWAEYSNKDGIKTSASNLDRKDSNGIYEPNNIVVCCGRCNKAKNTLFTYEEWLSIGNAIKQWRQS